MQRAESPDVFSFLRTVIDPGHSAPALPSDKFPSSHHQFESLQVHLIIVRLGKHLRVKYNTLCWALLEFTCIRHDP